jgi:hypothetical protein
LSAAWPLAGAHCRLCLQASSLASFVFFPRNMLCLSIQKVEGAVEYSFCKMDSKCRR